MDCRLKISVIRIVSALALVCFTLVACKREKPLKINFAGDVILDRGVDDELRLHGDTILVNAIHRINTGDYFFINSEGVYADSGVGQSPKFNLRAPSNRAEALKKAGVTHASVANNHTLDFGLSGFHSTLSALTQNGICAVGENLEPSIVSSKGEKAAVIAANLTNFLGNYCDTSFTALKGAVQSFSLKNPRIPLILYLHWGFEYQTQPRNWQRQLATALVSLGADLIIGHHPHVIQNVEFINGVPVFYSIGNFVADAYLPNTSKSLVVEASIDDGRLSVRAKPLQLVNYMPQVVPFAEQFQFVEENLSSSTDIGLAYTNDVWNVTAASDVDFGAESNLWLFPASRFTASVKRMQAGYYILSLHAKGNAFNPIALRGDVSELQIADINNDGADDVLVGIAKSVKFDPVVKKRLNAFTLRNGNFQALWLGTKFVHDLLTFNVLRIEHYNYLQTVEQDSLGNQYKGTYTWDNFGFALIKMHKIE